jgi:hypothetical protein
MPTTSTYPVGTMLKKLKDHVNSEPDKVNWEISFFTPTTSEITEWGSSPLTPVSAGELYRLYCEIEEISAFKDEITGRGYIGDPEIQAAIDTFIFLREALKAFEIGYLTYAPEVSMVYNDLLEKQRELDQNSVRPSINTEKLLNLFFYTAYGISEYPYPYK